MKKLLVLVALAVSFIGASCRADVVFSQPASGGLIPSCWVPPDGTDADVYAWETMTFAAPVTITEIQWQGTAPTDGMVICINPGYTLTDFGVMARYNLPSTGIATPGPVVGGVQRYNFRYVLPTPLALAASTAYCINIEGINGWSISQGSGGNGNHVTYYVGGPYFLAGPGDLAITMIGSGPPAISQQPLPVSTCAGSNATFTIASTSAGPLSYQWKRAGVPLVESSHLVGTQTPTLVIMAARAPDAGGYSCAVTNANGTTTSSIASLAVGGPPVMITQPVNATGCTGTTITLTAVASSPGTMTQQWRKGGVPIANAFTSSYSFGASAANAGTYDCTFTNSCGVTVSNSVLVTVNQPVTITQGPAPVTACLGTSATLSVVTGGGNLLGYSWRLNGVAIPVATNPTAATASLAVSPVSAADVGTYDCIVSGSCNTLTSGAAALTLGTCACSLADVAGGGADGRSPDGVVDGNDFVAFINSFAIGDPLLDPLADVAGGGAAGLSPDGVIDGSDFVAFVNAFALGC